VLSRRHGSDGDFCFVSGGKKMLASAMIAAVCLNLKHPQTVLERMERTGHDQGLHNLSSG
jgi:hypothetical protein